MEGFTSFLANNYIWFLIISLILLFALIGYLVDVKEIKSGKKDKKPEDDLKIIDFSTVDQSKSLSDSNKEKKNELNLDEYSKKMEEGNTEGTVTQTNTEQFSNTVESITNEENSQNNETLENLEIKDENK